MYFCLRRVQRYLWRKCEVTFLFCRNISWAKKDKRGKGGGKIAKLYKSYGTGVSIDFEFGITVDSDLWVSPNYFL